jgi:hypothetical protein
MGGPLEIILHFGDNRGEQSLGQGRQGSRIINLGDSLSKWLRMGSFTWQDPSYRNPAKICNFF